MSDFKMVEISEETLIKIQKLELDILKEVDAICRRNGIKYTLCGGSLLGAIRHKGFIPWDDDIDVSMLREDYDRFCEICKTELDSEKYFLQTTDTDPEYRFTYAKLLLNGTTYVRSGYEHMKYRTGIFIDIFPRDGVSDNPVLNTIQHTLGYMMRKILYSPMGAVRSPKASARFIFRILRHLPKSFPVKMLSFIKWLNFNKETDIVYCYGIMRNTEKRKLNMSKKKYREYKKSLKSETPQQKKERKIRDSGLKRCYFKELTDMPFEDMKAMVTDHYDIWLECNYGDYMKLPPEEKRKHHHTTSYYSLGKYENY